MFYQTIGSTLVRLMLPLALLLFSSLNFGELIAQESESLVSSTVILDGMNRPAGIAVHPGTQTVYVAESGNDRVIKIVEDGDGLGKFIAKSVITNFENSVIEDVRGSANGPHGIEFISATELLVGCCGRVIAEDRVHLFQLDTDADENPIDASKSIANVTIDVTGDAPPIKDSFAIATSGIYSYVVGRGDQKFGWINRLTKKSEDSFEFEHYLDTWQGTQTKLPTALAISPDGFVVVGMRGANGMGSVLAFYDQADALLKAKFELDQNGLVALAYGPNESRLFALFNSIDSPEKNGLYKLVGRKRNTTCELQLLESVDSPRTMAFDRSGSLFVSAGDDSGRVLKFEGLDRTKSDKSDSNEQLDEDSNSDSDDNRQER